MRAFIDGIPKAELHLHLEGSLEPELLFAIAQRNNLTLPYASVDDVRHAYQFSRLQDFLDIYYQGMSVLLYEQDFYDLTWAYLERVARDNVIHVEVFFDPQGHTDRGVPFKVVIDGIHRALEEGQKKLGISYRLIMCFLRHLSEESAFETLEAAMPYRDRLCGIGLDSSELGHPPSRFERVFAKARAAGLKAVAHAGEEGPPDYVWQALELLKVDRIDHGNRAMEDPALVNRLVQDGMALTVCPLSNLKLKVIETMQAHPLRRMLDAGIIATINSDDPAYFGGYMSANLIAVQTALNLNKDAVITLAHNGFRGSFLSETEKAAALARIDAFVVDAGTGD
ncbi:MAG: adenosine deaminase [Rhodospirillaceae bacterium]|nr:adenosine deaminase [Rhodospirillaceae bacterium]